MAREAAQTLQRVLQEQPHWSADGEVEVEVERGGRGEGERMLTKQALGLECGEFPRYRPAAADS